MLVKAYQDGPATPDEHRVHRPGHWLPRDHRIHREFVARVTEEVEQNPKELAPVIKEFKEFIETTPRVFMYFTQMFDEIPRKHPYRSDPTGTRQIRDYHQMLAVLNYIITHAPGWTDAAEKVGLVGVPMNAIFDYPMGTPSGHAAFLDPEVNRMLKKVLNQWGKYLETPESTEVLTDHNLGWFGKTGLLNLMEVANAPRKTKFSFEEMFICDPSAKNFGFTSWDDFFTRKLRESARPVAEPDNDCVIANACESKVYNLERNVKLRDKFFAKGQPYSVLDMMANDPLAHEFAGGTIYQAFLSALSYHRWHAPVSGTVKRAFVEDGTYFSEMLMEDLTDNGVKAYFDPDGLNLSQGYLSAMATRAVIVFEADNPHIGLVAFIGIGMDEVSSCDITVKEGQKVKKGDDIGMFHYGGSTHCLLFRKGLELEGFPKLGREANVPVRGRLAVVKH